MHKEWACEDGWMEASARRRAIILLMVGIWRALNGQHACAVWFIMDNSSSFFCEVVCMYIYQGAVVRWRAFGDAMINGGK